MDNSKAASIHTNVMRKALKIATDHAGRSLNPHDVWVELSYDGYEVHYSKPRTEGSFIADRKLQISSVEYYAYTSVEENR